MHTVHPRLLSALLAAGALAGLHLPSYASPSDRGAAAQEPTAPASKERAGRTTPQRGYRDYQVAAGTALPIELRTRLSSKRNQQFDEVEGRLLRPIADGDVELVPAGARVLGTVTDSQPATSRTPARLAFTFHVIEHPETGSRATIRSTELSFAAAAGEPAAPKRSLWSKAVKAGRAPLNDVELEKGSDATVTLLAPLAVRIPM
jgi:hypothetical protein